MEDSKKHKDPFEEYDNGRCETCKDKEDCSYIRLIKHDIKEIGGLITRYDDKHLVQWHMDIHTGYLDEAYELISIDTITDEELTVERDEVFILDIEDDERNIGIIQIPMLGLIPDNLRGNPFLIGTILGNVVFKLTYDFNAYDVLFEALQKSDTEIRFLYEELLATEADRDKLKTALDVEKKLNIRIASDDKEATVIPLRFR